MHNSRYHTWCTVGYSDMEPKNVVRSQIVNSCHINIPRLVVKFTICSLLPELSEYTDNNI